MTSDSKAIIKSLKKHNYIFYTGVPCSLLKGIFLELENNTFENVRYFPAIKEDSAVGLASGFSLSGNKSVVLMQNSGLGYCLNVLTSFNLIYDVPILLIISWRGYTSDAVEHDVIGKKMLDILNAVDISYQILDLGNIDNSIDSVVDTLNTTKRAAALIIKDNV
ncbi:hypothetical protein MM221_05190 [Salipaludibacillus sp. LMS25]|jgi:phosphonopyruvate decarboxylase|uniref:thiamine pyrophosphate-binding protein n=1 Tax=Salipaludibacillus sp. LMS25 TaxID=2924031 RepID=UPI0020D158F2|nr:thiamine pyrophosphate-binding protein [Salipaludibacillus sp. LMS25]UTR15956.1 hypothetical protein MM221_05190 [Salipaludibacillus sp. LMS25]